MCSYIFNIWLISFVLILILHKLANEARVRFDLTPELLDIVQTLLQANSLKLHQISYNNSGTPADAILAMDKHFRLHSIGHLGTLVYELKTFGELLPYLFLFTIEYLYVQVGELFRE